MVKTPQYKRILLLCSLLLVSFVVLNTMIPQKSRSFDLAELPDDSMVIEGYVVSKRNHSIWLAEEPISNVGIVSGYVKGYDNRSIKVSKSKDFEKGINFRQLQLNQKVRVYCDYIRESNPPKTVAFHIEVINNND
ncbi:MULTISPECIES: DUF3221 domain-containing protein [Sporosarcina]|uniref:DUF3221 domain-containing protein n=1 Tax=Sporosarcina contaminans TaxID=633403 RepID=A0ABW3TYZ6_9BACL